MVLQGKGGVGKSFIAALMAQYLQDRRGEAPLCIDTDPVNATFAGYAAFGVHSIDLIEKREINPRRFDHLVEKLAEAGGQRVIIDNGASTFVPLADYLLSYDVPALLKDEGHELRLHSVVTGGQSQDDTLQGLLALLKNFDDVPVTVWLNPFCGQIEKDGKSFSEMKLYREHKDRLSGVVEIPTFNPKTTGPDLSDLLKSRRPFREALNDPNLLLMTRQRLKMAQRELYARMDEAFVL
jgi:hypothetical protein